MEHHPMQLKTCSPSMKAAESASNIQHNRVYLKAIDVMAKASGVLPLRATFPGLIPANIKTVVNLQSRGWGMFVTTTHCYIAKRCSGWPEIEIMKTLFHEPYKNL